MDNVIVINIILVCVILNSVFNEILKIELGDPSLTGTSDWVVQCLIFLASLSS